jgi:hypothetical protein
LNSGASHGGAFFEAIGPSHSVLDFVEAYLSFAGAML